MNKSNPQQPNFVFYLDECLGGNKVYTALTHAGLSVELHSTHFQRGTPDDQWLPEVGKRGWILLTQDKRIRHRKNEILALRQNDVRAFIVTAKNLRGEEIGALIVKALPKILRILNDTEPPLVAMINRDSVVELKEGRSRHRKK